MRAGAPRRPGGDADDRRIFDLGLGNVRLGDACAPSAVTASGARYGEPAGAMRLRAAVAGWQRAEPDEVALTTGASLALVATLCTLPRPASILVPRPHYSAYSQVALLLGLDLLTYELEPERRWEPSAESIERSIRSDTRALVLNQPHNPTGGVMGAALLLQIATAARAAGLVVISDETYAGIVYDGAQAPDARAVFDRGDLVQILSFSKLFGMPGERLGCVIADPARVESISSAHWSLAMSPPASAQDLALAALQSRPDRHVRGLVDALARNRERAMAVLSEYDELRCVAPAGGCFAWIEVVDCPLDARSFVRRCREVGRVRVVGGQLFGVEAPVYVRASFAVPRDELTAGLRRLGQVAAGLRHPRAGGPD